MAEARANFDSVFGTDGFSDFEKRAVVKSPNFVHRQIYDGAAARIGNAAALMQPLEAAAIVSARPQITSILNLRRTRAAVTINLDAPVMNRYLS